MNVMIRVCVKLFCIDAHQILLWWFDLNNVMKVDDDDDNDDDDDDNVSISSTGVNV